MPTIRTPTAKTAPLNTAEAEAIIKRPAVAQASSYNVTAAHNREIHELADGITATLPTASGSLTETDDWFVTFKAVGATGATINTNSQNVDGSASDITLAQYETVTLAMNAGTSAFHKVNELLIALPVARGGTGATTAAGARTSLGALAEPGAWTTPTFSAGDFTASGSMTWTVASGDVTTYAYTKAGKVLTLAFTIVSSTVGGTLSNELRIAIPASLVATKRVITPVYIVDNGTASIGLAIIEASGTYVRISKLNDVNYSASTNDTVVAGQVVLEVN